MYIPRPLIIVALLLTLIVFLRYMHVYCVVKLRADKAEAVSDSLIMENQFKDLIINQTKDTIYGEENKNKIKWK
jgi:hypothetical protein